MRVAVIGAGTMGLALSARLVRAHHDVVIGTRRPDEVSGDLRPTSYRNALEHSEIVFLALPWPHGLEVVRTEPGFRDRIVVDVSNPESPDGRSLVLGFSDSGAETIARAAPEARVVKAFNHVYAELLMAVDPVDCPSILYCSDDDDAKRVVRDVILSTGLEAFDAGPLRNARYLEPLAMLTVHLVRQQGWGPRGIVWRLVTESSGVKLEER